jgi:hypothetical protein
MTATQPLTDEQYAAIRAREAAATPGPWAIEWDHDDVTGAPFPVSLGPIGYLEHHGERDVADAEFIAAAREDVPALLAHADRLNALLADRDRRIALVLELLRGVSTKTHQDAVVLALDLIPLLEGPLHPSQIAKES